MKRKLKHPLYKIKLKILRIIIFILLGISNRLIKIVKFKNLVSFVSNSQEDNYFEVDRTTRSRLFLIRRQIEIVSAKTPWRSMCFEQALTSMIILRVLNVSASIYFGIKRDENGNLKAHAWTRAADVYITGFRNINSYNVVYRSCYRAKKDRIKFKNDVDA